MLYPVQQRWLPEFDDYHYQRETTNGSSECVLRQQPSRAGVVTLILSYLTVGVAIRRFIEDHITRKLMRKTLTLGPSSFLNDLSRVVVGTYIYEGGCASTQKAFMDMDVGVVPRFVPSYFRRLEFTALEDADNEVLKRLMFCFLKFRSQELYICNVDAPGYVLELGHLNLRSLEIFNCRFDKIEGPEKVRSITIHGSHDRPGDCSVVSKFLSPIIYYKGRRGDEPIEQLLCNLEKAQTMGLKNLELCWIRQRNLHLDFDKCANTPRGPLGLLKLESLVLQDCEFLNVTLPATDLKMFKWERVYCTARRSSLYSLSQYSQSPFGCAVPEGIEELYLTASWVSRSPDGLVLDLDGCKGLRVLELRGSPLDEVRCSHVLSNLKKLVVESTPRHSYPPCIIETLMKRAPNLKCIELIAVDMFGSSLDLSGLNLESLLLVYCRFRKVRTPAGLRSLEIQNHQSYMTTVQPGWFRSVLGQLRFLALGGCQIEHPLINADELRFTDLEVLYLINCVIDKEFTLKIVPTKTKFMYEDNRLADYDPSYKKMFLGDMAFEEVDDDENREKNEGGRQVLGFVQNCQELRGSTDTGDDEHVLIRSSSSSDFFFFPQF